MLGPIVVHGAFLQMLRRASDARPAAKILVTSNLVNANTMIMTKQNVTPTDDLEKRATETAQLLGLLANGRRLANSMQAGKCGRDVRCAGDGFPPAELGLSQSALSQHLALLRADNLVGTRREGQTVYYSIRGPSQFQAAGGAGSDLLHR